MKTTPVNGKSPGPATAHHSTVFLALVSIGVGVAGGLAAPALTRLIGFVTNLCFYGRLSDSFSSPAGNHLGLLVIAVPVIGGVIVGLMARFGSKAIRGHGIPEAMEQVLENNSRIPVRVTILKPISAAISIGTGGPFGAEGPIIATGGALGSMVGQILSITAAERKTLLAAGAAAGMAGIFGSPVSAVLLAIELLLFEYRARSFVPVALASATAACMRIQFVGAGAVFPMPQIAPVTVGALAGYAVIGVATGVLAVGVTRAVYWVEDMFERMPVHWMWWPAIGGVAVGVIGYLAPRTLGVGYDNITQIISNQLPLRLIAFLTLMKFISWAISLGSGTSGGTLAPLLTIGGGAGSLMGSFMIWVAPWCGMDIRAAALVGMSAMFAGASRAMLTSVVFAFETTLQPNGLLPVLAGCAPAFLVARLLMRNSIMTEKIARRGLKIPEDYDPDAFLHTTVGEIMDTDVETLSPDEEVCALAERIARRDPGVAAFNAWPLVDAAGELSGIITRGDLHRAMESPGVDGMTLIEAGSRALVVAYPDETVHQAVARMAAHSVSRLPVVERGNSKKLVGYFSPANLVSVRLKAHRQETEREPGWFSGRGRGGSGEG